MEDNYTDNNIQDETVSEIPEITIIHEEYRTVPAQEVKSRKSLMRYVAVIAAILVTAAACAFAYYKYYDIGLSISVSPRQNIEKLKKTAMANPNAGVNKTSETIQNIDMDIYSLSGLSASVTTIEPDTADREVMFFCRCADHTKDGKYIGTLVIDGEEKNADTNRRGYCAMANGNVVIGISKSEKVKDYVTDQKGSFFRQFILLSDGEIPGKFILSGNVVRCALGRTPDSKLYFIQTKGKATMRGFAEALREYGFIDAIYLTGGDEDYLYYRTADGQRHDINDVTTYPHKAWEGVTPWLVFKCRK